uniref:Uncharacterized protein n=1 Tax=Octopus bimaculoides TaxID=37653 RepID=A0A0L8G9D2_OCTBM
MVSKNNSFIPHLFFHLYKVDKINICNRLGEKREKCLQTHTINKKQSNFLFSHPTLQQSSNHS